MKLEAFDFNVTLILFGLQFVCLTTVLINDFYRPVHKSTAYREKDAKKGEKRKLEIDEIKASSFKKRIAWEHNGHLQQGFPYGLLRRWIVQGRLVSLAHFAVGYIFTYVLFIIAPLGG